MKPLSIALAALALGLGACEKHTIEYDTRSIEGNLAEVQLHYFVPVKPKDAAYYINRVEFNDRLISTDIAPLVSYNGLPGGRVGAFYAVDPGPTRIRLYMTTREGGDSLVYDQTTTFAVGKQNVFVYDFDQPPMRVDNGFPYEALGTSYDTDSLCYIKFYNLLFGADWKTPYCRDGVRLQYRYIDPDRKDTVDIGRPLAFGESTDWEPVRVVKSIYNSSGYRSTDFAIMEVAADGTRRLLRVYNSYSQWVDYYDYWILYIGRRYHHIYSGMIGTGGRDATQAIRVWTAL